MLPAIRPKVAPAVQRVVAPEIPKSSRIGPKAPAVPWPPTIGMEPVHKPTRGLDLKKFRKTHCQEILAENQTDDKAKKHNQSLSSAL